MQDAPNDLSGNPVTMEVRNRRQLQLLLVAGVFAAPVLVFSGWMPRTQSYGQAILPQRSIADVTVQRADGEPFAWRDRSFDWTLVALPGPDCAKRCLSQLDLMHRARIGLGTHADKLRLLYLGTPPGGEAARGFDKVWTIASTPSHALDDLRATGPDSVSAVLVMPDGVALTLYPAGSDVNGLRRDLQKVIR